MQGEEFAKAKPSIGAGKNGPKLEVVSKKEGTGSPEPAQRMRSDGIKLFRVLKQSFLEFGEDDCVTMAASLSFYAIFSRPQIGKALCLLSEADRDLRRERPDDRIVMEQPVVGMTN